MEKMKTVMTSIGEFTLVKPKAGPRNRAMIKAEQGDGFKKMILVTELLPTCISKMPENLNTGVPKEQILDGMDVDDYDLLSATMMELMTSSADKELSEEEKKNLVSQ